uniref:Uncharacterized protein n=1 Tax=Scophthalmus maximus TaxID=52904 RepID=A0A8D3DQD6_SCOMX
MSTRKTPGKSTVRSWRTTRRDDGLRLGREERGAEDTSGPAVLCLIGKVGLLTRQRAFPVANLLFSWPLGVYFCVVLFSKLKHD